MDPDLVHQHSSNRNNVYPDPDEAPQYAWVARESTEKSSEELVTHQPEFKPNAIENSTSDRYAKDRYDYREALRKQDNPSIDPDFQYEEESSASEELVSEVDSDDDLLVSESSPILGDYSTAFSGTHEGRGGMARSRRGRPRKWAKKTRGTWEKGAKRGNRKPLEPSAEFKILQSEATMAFIDKDYDKAEDLVRQAIVMNPEIFHAYSLLSEIHMARGDRDRALAALFNGAHTRPRDTETWSKVAELIMERAGDDRASSIPDAVYCYNRVIGADTSHVQGRYKRAALHREMGYRGKAAHDYVRLLQHLPHDTTVLRHIAEIYIDIGDSSQAIKFYDEAVAHYHSLQSQTVSIFTWSDVNIYAELYVFAKQPKEGISKIKRISRWMLGRGEESFWDHYIDDDREYDAQDTPRRLEVQEYISGKHELSAYGLQLPLELRIKLGILRLRMGTNHFSEAMKHFSWLEPDNDGLDGKFVDYPDLFRETADALLAEGLYAEALRFYDPLQQIQEYANASYFNCMGSCYGALQMYDEAEDCYRTIVEDEPSNLDVYRRLAKMFEEAGKPDRAAPYITKIISLRRNGHVRKRQRPTAQARRLASLDAPTDDVDFMASSTFSLNSIRKSTDTPQSKFKAREALERKIKRENFKSVFDKMCDWKERFRAGDKGHRFEWMSAAATLIDDFKNNRIFFPWDRNTKFTGYKDRQSTSVPDDYCGIIFNEWLDIFLEYVVLLAEDGQHKSAYEVASVATEANIFYTSKESMFRIHVAWFMCALMANDNHLICKVCRYFTQEYQFVSDAYRLFATLNRICDSPRLAYNGGPSQKYFLRQVKAIDFALLGEDSPNTLWQERATYKAKDKAGNVVLPKDMDIALIMLYGQILYAGGSYHFAINYFYRAYALDPTHPLINLSLALAFIHYALKRQADNRHNLIMQGFTFLFAYYDKRKVSAIPSERQEARFNVGRAYHMLGLSHMAIPYYEQCLDMSDEVQRTSKENSAMEDYAAEAAYALQVLWAASGEAEMARKITERWLVF